MIFSELIDFLTRLGVRPNKRLSQNFLVDANIARKIVETAEIQEGDTVLEIGPGPGALTTLLLDAGATVIAVEMDRVFAKALHRLQNGRLTIIESDFLEFSLAHLPPNIKVVANLPYHISTPILEKLFAASFSSITIMVQKEVADRMAARAGTKDFSPLSLFVQFHATKHKSFPVAPTCFYPQPKVDSTVIRLNAKPLPDIDPQIFFPLVHQAFQHRRKMLTSSLDLPKEQIAQTLARLGIRTDARPEMLGLDAWVSFAKEISLVNV
jgi:16S rRNA (adenine1518-N6/adenine1519-N6)-dimethyltransferase